MTNAMDANRDESSSDEPGTDEPAEHAPSPHDAMFYKTFSRPEHAASLVKCYFSSELVAKVEWATMTRETLKFVDAKLRARYSDVLFSVQIAGKKAFIYVLFEHKSTNEWFTLLQVLESKPRIWRDYLAKESNHGTKVLPAILPIVLHHGEHLWMAPTRFRQYYDEETLSLPEFHPYWLDFGIVLDDIRTLDAEPLVKRPVTPEARFVLFVLRFGRTPNVLFAEIHRVVDEIQFLLRTTHGELVIASFIVYMMTVGKMAEAEVRVALQQSIHEKIAEDILYAGERRYEAGLREGERRGERKGKREGERGLLMRLLTARFGTLPANVVTHIESATGPQIERMSQRLLSASSLKEVLGEQGKD